MTVWANLVIVLILHGYWFCFDDGRCQVQNTLCKESNMKDLAKGASACRMRKKSLMTLACDLLVYFSEKSDWIDKG